MKKILVYGLMFLSFSCLGQTAHEEDSIFHILSQRVGEDQKIIKLLEGSIQRQSTNAFSAAQYASKALELASKIEDKLLIVRSQINLGYSILQQGFIDSAIYHYIAADSVAGLINYHKGRVGALNSLGGAYISQGLYTEALKYTLLALQLVEAHLEPESSLKPIVNLGVIYENMGEVPKALSFYRKAIDIASDIDANTTLAHCYHNMGNCYYKLQQNDSALFYFHKALSIQESINYLHAKGNTLACIGLVYKAIQQPEQALSYYYNALKIKNQVADNYGLTSLYSYMGELYLEQNQYDSALTYLQKGLLESRKNVFWDHQRFILEKLTILYSEIGKFKEAYQYQKEYLWVKDTLMSQDKARQLRDLQLKYETEQKEKQIALQKSRLQRQESNLKLSMIGGLSFILLLLLAFQRYRQSQKYKILEAEKIKELDRVKSNFFANISHEFRTPLTLIIGSLSKLLKNDHLSREELSADYQIMQNNSKKLLQLINQLLELSRLDEGKSRLRVSKVDLIPFIHRTLISFASYAEQKNIKVLFNGSDPLSSTINLSIEVYLDRDKMEKVFYNLFSNAIKYTPEEGRIEVWVVLDSIAKQVNIKIKNTGQGIPQEEHKKIFERFYQVHDPDNQNYEGTGIGLSLVKELVELHKGKVDVESKDLEYTMFIVDLWLGKDHFKPEEIVEKESKELVDVALETPLMRSKSTETYEGTGDNEDQVCILIVEDHKELREHIKGSLKGEYRILEAGDGKKGIELALEYIPDLIISDIMMPKMDGFELLKTVRENERTNHIPLVLLTAKAGNQDKLSGLELGADDYLIKPFIPEELQLKVDNLLTIRRQLQEKYSRQLVLRPNNVIVSSQKEKFLKKVMHILEENIQNETFGVEALSQQMHMSRVQLHRKLKAITNYSPSELLRNFRLEKAAELIRQDAGNMAEIAFRVGFNSQAHFSRAFQDYYECTPTAFKKNLED